MKPLIVRIGIFDIEVVQLKLKTLDELPQALEFEGSRLRSLMERNITIPAMDKRYWDSKRQISVRRK